MSDRVKCFWVEPSGRVELKVVFKDGREEKTRHPFDEGNRLFHSEAPPDRDHRCMSELYTLPDGSEVTSRELPAGAMYHARWLGEFPDFTGPDGIALTVVLPNGHHWQVDSQASNCTRPQRDAEHKFTRTHYCWCRHGDPKTGDVHVDKTGETCAAGAGSILSGDWHGFLHHGYLVQ